MLLAIYLNDHLAGATAGQELARRTAASNRSSEYGPVLERLATEIAEDRRSLLGIMDALQVGVDPLKVWTAWGMEKAGRLKLNGRLIGYSPLSRIVELEGLALGVTGKRALWRTLEQLQAELPVLDQTQITSLRERAERQLELLEIQRLKAVAEAFPDQH